MHVCFSLLSNRIGGSKSKKKKSLNSKTCPKALPSGSFSLWFCAKIHLWPFTIDFPLSRCLMMTHTSVMSATVSPWIPVAMRETLRGKTRVWEKVSNCTSIWGFAYHLVIQVTVVFLCIPSIQSAVRWPWCTAALRYPPPGPAVAWACGTSWGTTSERICPRWPCRYSSTSPSTPSRSCVKSWSTVSYWTLPTRPKTLTSAWWVKTPVAVYTLKLFKMVSDALSSVQVYVATFAISAYASTYHRAGSKPFNPVLGETYECDRPDKGFRFFAEQVQFTKSRLHSDQCRDINTSR